MEFLKVQNENKTAKKKKKKKKAHLGKMSILKKLVTKRRWQAIDQNFLINKQPYTNKT